MKPSPSKIFWPLFIITSSAIVSGLLIIYKPDATPHPAPSNSPPLVDVITVSPSMQRVPVVTQGTLTPLRKIDLTAQVGGQVVFTATSYARGGVFNENDILVSLDKRDFTFSLINAEAQLAKAAEMLALEKVKSRQAKQEWKDLGDNEANRIFLREPQLASAQANYQAALANKKLAQLNLERTDIRAPFAGRIEAPLVNLGQVVISGTPIAKIFDRALAEVRLPLSSMQARLLDLALLDAQQENQKPLPVTLTSRIAGKEIRLQAAVVRTDAQLDSQSRVIFAVAEVSQKNNPSSPLVMGAFVEASITGKLFKHTLRIPSTALTKRHSILLVQQDNTVGEYQVDLLTREGEQVWVNANIPANSRLIINHTSSLKMGSLITVRED